MLNVNVVYSGGTLNTEQKNSLGGFPSPVVVETGKNNLFNDVPSQKTTQGVIDYRCVYIFNDDADVKYHTYLFTEYLNSVGADIQLGVIRQNCVQNINFTSTATSGDFTIKIQDFTSTIIPWDNDSTVLAQNIKNGINSISECDISTVSAFNYNVTFKGILGNKSLTDLEITNNNLSPTVVPTITQITIGSPINTIATDTGIENLYPNGITFREILTPGIEIGTLFPAEGFPVWIRRVVSSGFDAVENDGFILKTRVVGTSF